MKIKGEVLFFVGITVFSLAVVAGLLLFKDQLRGVSSGELVREDSQVLGSNGEKVTLVEFGDFQCPACQKVEPVLQQLREEYEGKVRFVFRHFPLEFHKNAFPSARASEAAGEQGKFWEYHDLLYAKQTEWAEKNDPIREFETYAMELGLDINKFRESYVTTKFDEKINKDKSDGVGLKVEGTPTFFLNGEQVKGDYSYASFKEKIDNLLKD